MVQITHSRMRLQAILECKMCLINVWWTWPWTSSITIRRLTWIGMTQQSCLQVWTLLNKKKNASGYKIDLITLQKNPIKNFCHKKEEDPNAVTNWDRILEYTHYEPSSCSNCQQHCHSLYEMLIQPLSCQGQSMRSGKSSLLSCSRLASLTFSPSAFVPCALGGPGSPGPPRGVY